MPADEERDPTKYYLEMSCSSGPGKTAYPFVEPHDTAESARVSHARHFAQTLARRGAVTAAQIVQPAGKGKPIQLRIDMTYYNAR